MRNWLAPIIALGLSALGPGAWGAELKVLTFNTWLLPAISSDYLKRLELMPNALASTGADIIILQEVWRDQAKDDLTQAMRARGYPYAAFKPVASRDGRLPLAGYLDDGLLILSIYSISRGSVSERGFSEYTRPDEYFAGKGVLRAQVNLPEGPLDVYAAHLGAVTFDEDRLEYNSEHTAVRYRQAEEVAQFIRATRKFSVSLLAVDTNAHPYRWDARAGTFDPPRVGDVYALFQRVLGFLDATWNLHETGVTSFDLRRNRYAGNGVFRKAPSEFVDYVYMSRDQGRYEPGRSELVFTQPVARDGRRNVYLSDHFGVLARFESLSSRSANRASSACPAGYEGDLVRPVHRAGLLHLRRACESDR